MEQAYLTVASLPVILKCTLCDTRFGCSGSASTVLVSSFVSHVRNTHPENKDVNDAVSPQRRGFKVANYLILLSCPHLEMSPVCAEVERETWKRGYKESLKT